MTFRLIRHWGIIFPGKIWKCHAWDETLFPKAGVGLAICSWHCCCLAYTCDRQGSITENQYILLRRKSIANGSDKHWKYYTVLKIFTEFGQTSWHIELSALLSKIKVSVYSKMITKLLPHFLSHVTHIWYDLYTCLCVLCSTLYAQLSTKIMSPCEFFFFSYVTLLGIIYHHYIYVTHYCSNI